MLSNIKQKQFKSVSQGQFPSHKKGEPQQMSHQKWSWMTLSKEEHSNQCSATSKTHPTGTSHTSLACTSWSDWAPGDTEGGPRWHWRGPQRCMSQSQAALCPGVVRSCQGHCLWHPQSEMYPGSRWDSGRGCLWLGQPVTGTHSWLAYENPWRTCLCAWHSVKPDATKHWSLEQRKVYRRVTQEG